MQSTDHVALSLGRLRKLKIVNLTCRECNRSPGVVLPVVNVTCRQVKPYLPFELTHEGMLLRLAAYVQHQDFCSPKPEVWPPLSAVKVILSRPGQSCKDACWTNGKCTPCNVMRATRNGVSPTTNYVTVHHVLVKVLYRVHTKSI